jgi:hypothetical protein
MCTSIALNRRGYSAMQLAGPAVGESPRNVDAGIAVLREAVRREPKSIPATITHVTNQLIKHALHRDPDGFVIVPKLGARRGSD